MPIDKLINVLVTITLVEMMVAIGLGVESSAVIRAARDKRLLAGAALANYVCVPLAAIGLLLLLRVPPMVAAGFLIAAVCPGAPYGPPLTAIAKGDLAVSVGLMVILAGSSAIAAPLLLYGLLPITSGSAALEVDVTRMVATLLLVQLLPLGIGLTIRRRYASLARRLLKPAQFLSTVLNLGVIGLVLAAHLQTLISIRPIGYLGMLALVLAALAAGWLLGRPGSGNRKAMSMTTAVRNVGVSLVIATSSFPGTPAVTATLAFGLFQTVVVALVALVWGRWAPGAVPCAGGKASIFLR